MKRRPSRRELLGSASGLAASAFLPRGVEAAAHERVRREPILNVRDFGAKGDGKSDDTTALRRALQEAEGGGVVALPQGSFVLSEPIELPPHVALEGVFRAPSARGQHKGTTLLCVQPAGDPLGPPLITLREGAVLKGLALFYPEQRPCAEPVPYPWTVRGVGDNCALIDLLLVNPYQAVDLGTHAAGRHLVRGLYGQPLWRGLHVDQCLDVGRIADVHFWPFWENENKALLGFVRERGEAFVIGRCDWEYLDNCFCLGYRIGYHFVGTPTGSANALLTQCGADLGPTAVRVDASQQHAGISFVNGQFMAGVEVGEGNRGPLKFTSCGFWGVETTDSHVVLEGRGHTTFLGCHFADWGRRDAQAPAIDLRRGGLSVSTCAFLGEDRVQIRLARDADAAIVTGNRFGGSERVIGEGRDGAQVGLNATAPRGPKAEGAGRPRAGLLEGVRSLRWRA